MPHTPRPLALEFHPALDDLEPHKELRDGLSAVLQIGNTLWVANDESASVERLVLAGSGDRAGEHAQFPLIQFLDLPLPPEGDPAVVPEVDVEGLDLAGGYLWVVGSHSQKRKKPDPDDGARTAQKQLAKISIDANRYLLARIPVVQDGAGVRLEKKHTDASLGKLTAARLRDGGKDVGAGNELMHALADDKHLGAFLAIPGKDNGFDVEGIAVAGNSIFLGLRGPVLRGWAIVLEVQVDDDGPHRLRLKPMDDKGHLVRKHFLQLGGAGVRDLCVHGDDLLILAGPTMDLDGTIRVLRWPGGARRDGPSVVPADALRPVLDLPHGTGCDRAEGITLFTPPGRAAVLSLLVVHDAASEARRPGDSTLIADVYPLPGA